MTNNPNENVIYQNDFLYLTLCIFSHRNCPLKLIVYSKLSQEFGSYKIIFIIKFQNSIFEQSIIFVKLREKDTPMYQKYISIVGSKLTKHYTKH